MSPSPGMDSVIAGFDVRMQLSNSFAEEADNNNVDAKFRAECRIREGTDACGTFNWSNPKFLRLDLAPAAANLRNPESYEWDEFEIDYGVIQDEEDAFKIDFETSEISFGIFLSISHFLRIQMLYLDFKINLDH